MKKYLIPVAAFVAGMAMVPNTFALENTNVADWTELKACLAETEAECKVTSDFSYDGGGDTAEGVHVTGEVVLDLGSHTLDFTNMPRLIWVEPGAELTIKGDDGKIVNDTADSTGATIFVYGDTLGGELETELTVEKGVTIEGFNPVMVSTKDNKAAENVTVNIAGDLDNNVTPSTDITAQALGVHGYIQEGSKPEINVSGNLTGVDAGFFLAGQAETTVKGGSVKGQSGIAIKSGELALEEATVTATGEYNEGDSSNNGFSPTGAAVQIESNPEVYAGEIEIAVNNSTLTSENGDVFQVYGEEVTEDAPSAFKSLKITGDKVVLKAGEGRQILALAEGVTAPTLMTVNGVSRNLAAMGSTFTTVELTSSTSKPLEEQKKDEPVENPNTADNMGTYLTIATVAILGLLGTTVAAVKMRH